MVMLPAGSTRQPVVQDSCVSENVRLPACAVGARATTPINIRAIDSAGHWGLFGLIFGELLNLSMYGEIINSHKQNRGQRRRLTRTTVVSLRYRGDWRLQAHPIVLV